MSYHSTSGAGDSCSPYRAWQVLIIYLQCYYGVVAVQVPVNVDYLLEFIALLRHNEYAPATISTYTSLIGFYHRVNDYPDPANHPLVLKVFKSIPKDPALQRPADPRRPVPLPVLQQLLDQLQVIFMDNPYNAVMFSAMFVLLFCGCLRINELCLDVRNPHNILQLGSISFRRDGSLMITFMAYKHHTGQL